MYSPARYEVRTEDVNDLQVDPILVRFSFSASGNWDSTVLTVEGSKRSSALTTHGVKCEVAAEEDGQVTGTCEVESEALANLLWILYYSVSTNTTLEGATSEHLKRASRQTTVVPLTGTFVDGVWGNYVPCLLCVLLMTVIISFFEMQFCCLKA